jgi:hypothetical protein
MNIIFKNYLDTSKPGPVMQYLTKQKIIQAFYLIVIIKY